MHKTCFLIYSFDNSYSSKEYKIIETIISIISQTRVLIFSEKRITKMKDIYFVLITSYREAY